MRVISLIGFFIILSLAWLVSFNRRDVKLRPVIWGIALLLILAIIIFRQDALSFVGMTLLALLVIVYLLERTAENQQQKWQWRIFVVVGALLVGALSLLLPTRFLIIGFFVLIPILLINGRFKLLPNAQKYASALLIIFATASLIKQNLHGNQLFQIIGDKITSFLNLSDYGARFLFGNLADPQYYFPNAETNWPGLGFLVAFKVLPVIIFFSALMALLYYLGIMQSVLAAVSRFVCWTTGTSGAETLVCTANIFIGQTEAPLLIRPYMDGLTNSEVVTVMLAGFATMAGSTLGVYGAFGIPIQHILAASVLSAPAALVIAKILFPEKEHPQTAGDVEIPKVHVGANVFEALANGIGDGLKLAANVGAMLIGFIALVAALDSLFSLCDYWIDGRLLGGEHIDYAVRGLTPVNGEYVGIFPGSLQTLFGTIMRPVAWLIGVQWSEAAQVGNLIGIQLSLNEFIAYGTLGGYIRAGAISERSMILTTYAICSFANFSSIGIQIGGLSALVPGRKKDFARFALRAMFGGAMASWLTAALAGMLL
ncbi:MAG: nucleoside transporter C-terminal domain-containing protein [Acidobacteriota bacterium]